MKFLQRRCFPTFLLALALVGCRPVGGNISFPLEKLPEVFLVEVRLEGESRYAPKYAPIVARAGQPLHTAIKELFAKERHGWEFTDPRIAYAIEPIIIASASEFRFECVGETGRSSLARILVESGDPLFEGALKTYPAHKVNLNNDTSMSGERSDSSLLELMVNTRESSPKGPRAIVVPRLHENPPAQQLVKRIRISKRMTCDKMYLLAKAQINLNPQ